MAMDAITPKDHLTAEIPSNGRAWKKPWLRSARFWLGPATIRVAKA